METETAIIESPADDQMEEEAPIVLAGVDLPTWYLGQLAQLKALREAVKEQAKVILAQIDARESKLSYRHGPELVEKVDADIKRQGGKKKSVDYATGRSGYRTQPEKVRVTDDKALLEWCIENCPEAVGQYIQYMAKVQDAMKRTGEIPPGLDIEPSREKFYAQNQTMPIERSHYGSGSNSIGNEDRARELAGTAVC